MSKQPGEWVSARARREGRRTWLLIGAVLAVMLLVAWASLGLRNTGLTLILLVVMCALYRVGTRRFPTAANWGHGARSEVAVGETLRELIRDGYVVMHDIESRMRNGDRALAA